MLARRTLAKAAAPVRVSCEMGACTTPTAGHTALATGSSKEGACPKVHLRLALAQLAQLLLAQLQRGGQHARAAAQLRALLLHRRQLALQVLYLVLQPHREPGIHRHAAVVHSTKNVSVSKGRFHTLCGACTGRPVG